MLENKLDTVSGAIKNKTVLLLILDGWGISPSWSGNAISFSDPKNFNTYWRNYPHTILQAFQGIADESGNVGNSEIGHASIGAGRIVRQDITEINEAIKRGYFFQNPMLVDVCRHVKKFKSRLHLVGLLSNGGIHSHMDHLLALLRLAKLEKVDEVCLHIITDGIDAPDRSAIYFVQKLQDYMNQLGVGKIVNIIGRFYAMDKSGNSNRMDKAYYLQTQAKGQVFNNAVDALKYYYAQGIFDAYIPPTVITNSAKGIYIEDYDGIIFYNFRADRIQSLARAYTDKNYSKSLIGRKYKTIKDLEAVSLTSYMLPTSTTMKVAFPVSVINDNLGALISRAGLSQLRVAESEKAAHVTYFFNGGALEPYEKEQRVIVSSPNVASYDMKPEMSTEKIADVIIKAIKSNQFQFIVANIANIDMVAHTGNILATSEAIRFTDKMLKKIIDANKNNITIITADHGNAEQIIPYKTSSNRETLHTVNPVPFIVIKNQKEKDLIQEALSSSHAQIQDILTSPYNLADVAPTILELLNIAKPASMTGQSLLNKIGYK